MASARSFLVNDNPDQDIRMLDLFIDSHLFDNPMFQNLNLMFKNSSEIVLDSRYNCRPDLLSYEIYGTNFWYPIILTVNKLGSIFQFKAESLGNRCLIPDPGFIQNLLDEYEQELMKKEETLNLNLNVEGTQ